jgi:hypothetical protein
MTSGISRRLLCNGKIVHAGSVLCLSLLPASMAGADAVTEWNRTAGVAARAACISPAVDPLHESRLYAMVHVAIHDALNAIERRSRPYAFDVAANPGADPDAAVAAAARDALVTLIGQLPLGPECNAAGIAAVETAYQQALLSIPDGTAETLGIETGQAAAAAILAQRAADGSDAPLVDPAYPQGTEPGEYRFTPGFDFVFLPGWAHVTPFVLAHSSQFLASPPYSVKSEKYAADFNEIKALGGTVSARTADETEIALFWVESSPLQWNRIARTVSASQGLDLWQNARLFGLLNLAMADGYISSFATKYRYNFWRPVTAISEADTDGNPDTTADPTWAPLVQTPPIPDHDSAHSVEGAAAAEVFRQFFGTDDISFSTCSLTLLPGSTCDDPIPVPRAYSSFSEAEAENGLSRILVGFHFRHAVEEGIQHGRKIGRRAVQLFLRPTP